MKDLIDNVFVKSNVESLVGRELSDSEFYEVGEVLLYNLKVIDVFDEKMFNDSYEDMVEDLEEM